MSDTKTYDALRIYLLRGTGFIDGKKRIREYFAAHDNIKDRAEFVKQEFGTGGFGMPCNEPYILYAGDHGAKGHTLRYYDADMNEVTEHYTHRQVVKKIDELIADGVY